MKLLELSCIIGRRQSNSASLGNSLAVSYLPHLTHLSYNPEISLLGFYLRDFLMFIETLT